MAKQRAERLADNEALFRAANERMSRWPEQHSDDEREPYFCECANRECREKVYLTRAEYERVRANPMHFFIVPGHEVPDVERIIDQYEGWLVIEKNSEVRDQVEASDPRT